MEINATRKGSQCVELTLTAETAGEVLGLTAMLQKWQREPPMLGKEITSLWESMQRFGDRWFLLADLPEVDSVSANLLANRARTLFDLGLLERRKCSGIAHCYEYRVAPAKP